MRKKKINKFLNGELTEEEFHDFKIELHGNEEFLEETAESAIKEYGRVKLKNKLNAFDKELSAAKKSNFKYYTLAAVFILALGIPLFLNIINNKNTEKQIFASYFIPYNSVVTYRGDESNEHLLLSQGMLAYSNKNYTEAINKLTKIESKTFVVNFYLGVSYLGITPPKEKSALQALNQVLKTDNDFTQQANWYKALAYISLKETEKARILLTTIITNKWYNDEKASEILKQL